MPSRKPHSGEASVNREVQCDVQGAKTVQPLLALLCFPPLKGKRRQASDRGYSWRDLSMILEELPNGMVDGWSKNC